MSDAEKTNDILEGLVAQYETGVANPEEGDPSAWLNARSEIESQWDQLTEEQANRVSSADETLVENATQVAARFSTQGSSLADQRSATPRPPEQWWWYLDVLGHVSEYYGAEGAAKQPSTLVSRILTVVEVVVLVIAVIMLGINAPNIIARVFPTAQPSQAPTFTPAPTETLNPQALNLSAATPFKAPNDVVEIQLPPGWTQGPQTQPNLWEFSYNSTVYSSRLQVLIGQPQALYQDILGLTATVESPDAALTAFQKSFPSDSGAKFDPIRAIKIGKLDGHGIAFTFPNQQGGPASQIEVWIAPLPNAGGKIAFVIMRAVQDYWDQFKPVLYQMADSLIINAQNIPTETPTATVHPLNATQTSIAVTVGATQTSIAATVGATLTAVEQTITALTPTVTPTPAASAAATGAATGAATAPEGTAAATPPAAATAQ